MNSETINKLPNISVILKEQKTLGIAYNYWKELNAWNIIEAEMFRRINWIKGSRKGLTNINILSNIYYIVSRPCK